MSARCPYCRKSLAKTPTRKTTCPSCGNTIYVRQKKLLTEERVQLLDWSMRLQSLGISQSKLSKQLAATRERLGPRATVNDAVWEALNLLVIEQKDPQDRSQVYWEMAQLAESEDKNPRPYLEESSRQQLLGIAESGVISMVQIRTAHDEAVCHNCRNLSGVTYTIQQALEELPVPRQCTNERGCRCWYVPVIE